MLTDEALQGAQPRAKQWKLHDTGGLYILVRPNGALLWRIKYNYRNREQGLSLGKYPAVSLQAARVKRDEIRDLLEKGIDPSARRKHKRRLAATVSNRIHSALTARRREESWLAGNRAAYRSMLSTCVRELGYENASHAAWIAEREDAIRVLRELSSVLGCNDWTATTNLADIIAKWIAPVVARRLE